MKDIGEHSYALSPYLSKDYLHEWARRIMVEFPILGKIMTESRLRGLGVELLIEAEEDFKNKKKGN